MKRDKSASYRITTVHPTGYRDGEHTVEVRQNKDGVTRYVSGGGFGCSRDYWTPLNTVAIANLLAENGMRMVKCVKV